MSRRRWLALALVVLLLLPVVLWVRGRGGEEAPEARPGPVEEVTSPAAFARREERFVDSLLAVPRSDWWDLGARQGLVLLDPLVDAVAALGPEPVGLGHP